MDDEFGGHRPAIAARLYACAARFSDLLAQLGDCPEADQARARLAEAVAWAEAAARGDSILRT
jgi:hypothetical protein